MGGTSCSVHVVILAPWVEERSSDEEDIATWHDEETSCARVGAAPLAHS